LICLNRGSRQTYYIRCFIPSRKAFFLIESANIGTWIFLWTKSYFNVKSFLRKQFKPPIYFMLGAMNHILIMSMHLFPFNLICCGETIALHYCEFLSIILKCEYQKVCFETINIKLKGTYKPSSVFMFVQNVFENF
jgi:hypothetical protein